MSRRRERVAVAVVTYNSAELLPDLVASLPGGMAGTDWHLVVADNDSHDDTLAELTRLVPEATVVPMGRNAGYAAGINAAVAAAPPHDSVLVLNPDVRLDPGCAAVLAERLALTGAGVAVPRLRDRNGVLIESQRRAPTVRRALADAVLGARRAGRIRDWGEMVSDAERYDAETWTDWAEGSTQLVGREAWEACGGWDASFFLYSEETDFALRATDAGLRTRYVPGATAVHLEGDSGSNPALWALLVLNKVRLFRKRHGIAHSAAFWAVLTVRELTRAALGNARSRLAVRALLSPRTLRSRPGPELVAELARG